MMIMKTIKILSIGLIVLLAFGFAGYKYINWAFNQPCDPPERPEGVPIEAKWFGGCDGGSWLEFVEYRKDENKYRFRIYLDYVATVMLDADYTITEGCSATSYSRDISILNKIGRIESYFKKLYFIDTQECYLKPIYPANGGDYWEILKEDTTEWQNLKEK